MISFKKLALTGALALTAASSFATTLTFDSFDASQSLVNLAPTSYGGFSWNNFLVSDNTGNTGPGYTTGAVNGINTAFNGGGDPASFSSTTPFTLNEAFFAGAWNDGLNLRVVATTADQQTLSKDLTLNTGTVTDVVFNWSNLSSVSFVSSGGTRSPNAPVGKTGGTQFTMDNLTVNATAPVPEPETYALLLAGMGLVGAAVRRRKAAP